MKKKIVLLLTLFVSALALVLISGQIGMYIARQSLNLVPVVMSSQALDVRHQITADDLISVEVPSALLNDDILLEKDQVVGRWTDLQGKMPAHSFFYRSLLKESQELPDQPALMLLEGQAVYPLPVSVRDTGGQLMQPGLKADLYVYALDADRQPLMDCLIRSVRILQLQDRRGQPLEGADEQADQILLAMDKELIPLVSKAEKNGRIELYVGDQLTDGECFLNAESVILQWLR